jgi:short-subunit dehydrogenase
VGKNIIITGASSGIGLELATRYALRGDRVAMLARRGDRLESAAASIRSRGGEVLPLVTDVTDAAAVRQAVEETIRRFGSVDLAIANAGIGTPTYGSRFVLSEVEAVLATNLHGMLYLFDAAVPAMIARGSGQFVGIASLAGKRGLPTAAAYSASKAAMQAFLESVRSELRAHGVSVTTVNPGFIRTEMTAGTKFRMPMLMNVDRAAQIMIDAIDRRAGEISFPLPMALAVGALRLLPNRLYDFLVARRPPPRSRG